MPKNVVITPASGLIDFKDDAGNIDAIIQLDDSGNLNITNTGGSLSLGATASDVYIGDGTNSVDIIFEQNGDIRALTGKTLTLGQSDSSIAIASPITSNVTITGILTANNVKTGFTSTVTAAGTTTLTSLSNGYQRFTGTTTQTIVLPVTSTLTTGVKFEIENASTGNLTVNSSGGNLVITIIPGTTVQCMCIGTTLTTAADWDPEYIEFATITGTGSAVLSTTPTLVTPILGLATGTSVMLSANIGAAAGNVSGNFTAGNFQTAGNVNSQNELVTGSLPAGTLQTTGNVNANNLRVVTNSSLGTVVSGTWNGASISTTYTDAKVTSVNGQTGAATGFATTANSLSQFASTTSAQLATLISDETGSGALVFGTSPAITTSLTTPSSSFDLINTTATTVNFARAATTLSVGSTSGTTTVNNDLVVTGNVTVNGTTTTINAVTVTVDDKNIELGSVASPTDVTADGGGITLKGATDKTFNYVNATTAWTSSEDLNLLTGKSYEINGTSVLNATTLGSGVVNSSLTSVGTLGSLAVTNNVSAGAFLTTGSSTAGTFQTAGSVNANNLRVVTNSSLGTVVSGTWNGASISTTYTDAKVTSVNGQTGAATGFATTANTLAQFASTTSAQLATLISDETGSGSLVFATTPTLVTPVLGLATGTSVMLSANIGAAAGNISGNFSVTGNVVASNVTVSNRVNFGNTASTVKVYQFYNGVAASFDTVFV